MTDSIDPLIRDLLAWLGPGGKPYADVMEAWRTSCPRLPVWEDANERGFVSRTRRAGVEMVVPTHEGIDFLATAAQSGPPASQARPLA